MRHFEILLRECDSDIRGGHPDQAIRRLNQTGTNRIPQEWRLPLAKICRRVGLYSHGLRLLDRLVHGPRAEATPAELTEYSALLVRSGAVSEAFDHLKSVDPKQVPEALLIRAFALFSCWEYTQAIPDLENYLKTPLSPDAILVGRSNLAVAHLETRHHEEARRLFEENIGMAREQGYSHLETYNIGMLAQVYLQEGNFRAALKTIGQTEGDVAQAKANNDWSVIKLKMIIEGLENKNPKPLAILRQQALERKDWSALRAIDLYSLKIHFDQELFLHLYFGSPLPGFREHIAHELGRVPDRKIYVLGQKSAPRFDLETGEIDGHDVIRAGSKCHQLIRVLLRDFYQPLRIGSLHAALYPHEYFDVSSSPNRVHQMVWRTRRWFETNKIPLSIREEEGFFSLVIDGPFSFRVPIDQQPKNSLGSRIEKLEKVFPGGELFSAKQMQNVLGISTTSAHRLLQQAIESGTIERLGKTKRPSGYRFRKAA